MTTNWNEEKYEALTQAERNVEKPPHANPKSLVPMPTPKIDQPLSNRVEAKSLHTADYTQWKRWFIGWDMMLAALAGVVIFFFLNATSFGVLGSTVTAAGIVAAVGLGHYLLWGRVFAR